MEQHRDFASTLIHEVKPVVVGVISESSACAELAANLATQLGLPLVDTDTGHYTHWLCLTPVRLELRETGLSAPGPLFVDFTHGRAAHRRRFGGGRNQPLARAVGLKDKTELTVIDATAGLGQDAFVLASLGCTVSLLERSPIIAALLQDGLLRAGRDAQIGSWVQKRLYFLQGDSRDYLAALPNPQRPDVVYLDPMYPHRRKSALVKKEMRMLRALVGHDEDAPQLLVAALACARWRVVVKRPLRAPVLSGTLPTFQISTPNTRFDVYLVNLVNSLAA